MALVSAMGLRLYSDGFFGLANENLAVKLVYNCYQGIVEDPKLLCRGSLIGAWYSCAVFFPFINHHHFVFLLGYCFV